MPARVKETILGNPSQKRAVTKRPIGGFFLPGFLTLSDGQSFSGLLPSWQEGAYGGEVVFSTGMTGYVESLTDPSYAEQILTFTYPLIGNYGVASSESWESEKIHASGVVIGELCQSESHAQSEQSFLQWLRAQRIPLITGVDTRSLTKHLRVHGTLRGIISEQVRKPRAGKNSSRFVSIKKPQVYNAHYKKHVILVDCGLKLSILRSLLTLPVKITRVPHDFNYSKLPHDAVVISNGPGNPTDYAAAIAQVRKSLRGEKPVFGICLGSQLMALAAGAKTYKLPFGHRGHNQPCLEVGGGKGYITSQNHGYAVDADSLSEDWQVTFRNLNDNSVEGIAHKEKPFFSVQFHPEARPGPTDTAWLFRKFARLI